MTRSVPCPDCGAAADWAGVQALLGESLRWDVELTCAGCGFAVAECGGAPSEEMRRRLIAEHGRAVLLVRRPVANASVMRVLRAQLGVGLAEAKTLLGRVLAAQYSGTLPEMELLARGLRAAGVDAVATPDTRPDRWKCARTCRSGCPDMSAMETSSSLLSRPHR
ncbi:hypothetical protein ACIBAG_21080 [Streptomyces sp. NPDC051243]|uniref:hypothetical protein n=1 Tax=Streptomyces sp. NPDC051243 TaxID=3365646 RepID=UPI0037BD39C7